MIIRQSIQSTSGTQNNVSQSFYQNIFYDSSMGVTTPFAFEVPQYTTVGGTSDYYGQNPLAIFTNLVKPFIRFTFSANTSNFGPNTHIKHDIYRVSWDGYRAVQSGLMEDLNDVIETKNTTTETIEEIDGSTGEVRIKTINRTLTDSQNKKVSHVQKFSGESSRLAKEFPRPTINDIQDMLDVPIYSITASTTGITTNVYDFQIDQFTKRLGDYKTELFEDRAQYIIDTSFIFNRSVTPGLMDYEVLDSNGDIVSREYTDTITASTDSGRQVISQGDFSGLMFPSGKFFTYFTVPDKPILEYPSPTGQTNTFTPEIFWTNGENADQYLVQVTYSTGDTSFSGTVFSYIVPKEDEFKETATSRKKGPDSEFTTTKAIRKYQLSLKSNKCLLYRIGNVKFIENIFGVKQSVVTFSESNQICTQTEPIKSYVFTESDSPYTEVISGYSTPPSLEDESPMGEYILSGVVSGSTVTGATMQLTYPNGSYVTTSTNSIGEFYFDELEEGLYTINTSYRGYSSNSTIVNLTGDTSVFIELEIRWDNDYDIWDIKENDIIKY